MTRKNRALLMTALILPGLGQLYLGRSARGIALILLTNLLLLLALVVLLKAAAPALSARLASGAVSPADIMTGLEGSAGYVWAPSCCSGEERWRISSSTVKPSTGDVDRGTTPGASATGGP